ncbi:uncharacterized protein [Channa argus]|uniref:uncharacterized protein isoform X2 n=1 Tax=Channa argus TaxID=215402 RepID=UPI00352104AB
MSVEDVRTESFPAVSGGTAAGKVCFSEDKTRSRSQTLRLRTGLIMSSSQLLLCFLTALSLTCLQAVCLQCFGCNIGGGGHTYVELGCSKPEIINCSQTERGFKLRSCITTYSKSLDLVLSRGCATSRHCHQAELPGVSVNCCHWSLCNHGRRWTGSVAVVIISCWFPLQSH